MVLEMRTVLVRDGGRKLEGQSRSFHRPHRPVGYFTHPIMAINFPLAESNKEHNMHN